MACLGVVVHAQMVEAAEGVTLHALMVEAVAWKQLRFQHYHMSSVCQGSCQQHSCSGTRRPSWHPGRAPHFCSCHLVGAAEGVQGPQMACQGVVVHTQMVEAAEGVTLHAQMVEAAEGVRGPLMACQGVVVRTPMVEAAWGSWGPPLAVENPCWQAGRCHTCSV